MTESQILTLNERMKAVSGYFFNLSAVLVATAVARIWVKSDMDFAALIWFAGGAILLWIGWSILYLLEPEGEEKA
jgi:threonine/homoserine/homoserine lactone efflux protein